MFVDIIAHNLKAGLYQINKNGEVWSNSASRIMKIRLDKDGYPSLSLRNTSGGYSNFSLHRMLLTTFKFREDYQDLTVNHKDGNKMNYSLSNLEWMTIQENNAHANETGLRNVKLENHPKAKLTNDDVLNIVEMLNNGRTNVSIAREYGVNPSAISKIKTGATWSSLTGIVK